MPPPPRNRGPGTPYPPFREPVFGADQPPNRGPRSLPNDRPDDSERRDDPTLTPLLGKFDKLQAALDRLVAGLFKALGIKDTPIRDRTTARDSPGSPPPPDRTPTGKEKKEDEDKPKPKDPTFGQRVAHGAAEGFIYGGASGALRGLQAPAIEKIVGSFGKMAGLLGPVGTGLAGVVSFGALGVTALKGLADGIGDLVGTATSTLFQLAGAANPHSVEIFNEAVGVLSAKIGQYCVPVVSLLSAGVLTVADLIDHLAGDSLNDWADVLTGRVVPAILQAAQALLSFVATGLESVSKFVQTAREQLAGLTGKAAGGATSLAMKAMSFLPGGAFLGGKTADTVGNAVGATAEAKVNGADPLGGLAGWAKELQPKLDAAAEKLKNFDIGGSFSKNFGKVRDSMQSRTNRQFGGEPGFQGLGDLWKSLQTNLMKDPMLEAQLREQQKANETLANMYAQISDLARRPGGLLA